MEAVIALVIGSATALLDALTSLTLDLVQTQVLFRREARMSKLCGQPLESGCVPSESKEHCASIWRYRTDVRNPIALVTNHF